MPISGFLGVAIAWLAVRNWAGSEQVWTSWACSVSSYQDQCSASDRHDLQYPFHRRYPAIFPGSRGGRRDLGRRGSARHGVRVQITAWHSARRGGALHQITPAIEEAAISLGATTAQTLRKVSLPLIRPALLSGLTYAFARSMTTLSPIIFLTTPSTLIITNEINGEVAAGRFGNAFAYCTVLIAIVLCGIAALNLVLRSRAKPHPMAHRGIRRRPRPPASIHATRGIT